MISVLRELGTGDFNIKGFCFPLPVLYVFLDQNIVRLNAWTWRGNTGYSQSLVFNISFSLNRFPLDLVFPLL